MIIISTTLISEFGAPKSAPRTGITNVRYATISKIKTFERVAIDIRNATIEGAIKATLNLGNVRSSFDKTVVAKKNRKPVPAPVALPTNQILIDPIRYHLYPLLCV